MKEGCWIQCTCVELLIIVLLLGHPRLLLLKKASWLNKEVGFERWDGHCLSKKYSDAGCKNQELTEHNNDTLPSGSDKDVCVCVFTRVCFH